MYALIVANGIGYRESITERLVGSSYIGITWPSHLSGESTQTLLLQHALGQGTLSWLDPKATLTDLYNNPNVSSLSIGKLSFTATEERSAKEVDYSLRTAIGRFASRQRNLATELWNYQNHQTLHAKKQLWADLSDHIDIKITLEEWKEQTTENPIASELDRVFFKELFAEMTHPVILEFILGRILSKGIAEDTLYEKLTSALATPEPVLETTLVSEPTLLWLLPSKGFLPLVPKSLPGHFRLPLENLQYDQLEKPILEEMLFQLTRLPDKDFYSTIISTISETIAKRPLS